MLVFAARRVPYAVLHNGKRGKVQYLSWEVLVVFKADKKPC